MLPSGSSAWAVPATSDVDSTTVETTARFLVNPLISFSPRGALDTDQQPRTLRIRVASSISERASPGSIALPLSRSQSSMKPCSSIQATPGSGIGSARARRAASSLASSAIRIPGLMVRPFTVAIRSASCSSAPSTCTVKLHDAGLPAGSAAVAVTVVVPIGNTLPDTGELVGVAIAQLSDAVGAKPTGAPSGATASTTIGAGQRIVGGSTSFTVTSKLQAGDRPVVGLSANELTVVVPTGNALPEAGVDCAVTSGHMPSTTGANDTAALHSPGALGTAIGAGHWIVGTGSGKFGVRASVTVSPPSMASSKCARYSTLPPKSGPRNRALPTATSTRFQPGASPVPSLKIVIDDSLPRFVLGVVAQSARPARIRPLS